jgi:hypothetical protein
VSVDVSHYRRFAEQMAGKPGAINNSAAACLMLQLCSLFEERWISVSERLPGANERVLIFCPLLEPEEIIGATLLKASLPSGGAWSCDDGQLLGETEPTHWMPLPEPPEVT